VLFLTGTPIMNRPEEIFPIYHSIAPQSLRRSWTDFTDRFCNAYTDRFGRHTHGASNLHELHDILKKFTVRRLKKDVLPQLPDKRRQFIDLPPDNAAVLNLLNTTTKTGAELEAEIKKLRQTGQKSPKLDDKLKELAVLRKQQGMAKLPAAISHIRDVMASLDPDGKLIIFAHHGAVISELEKKLRKYQPAVITGKTSTANRDFAVKRFQDTTGCRIFIGNIQAAGTGLTLTAASMVVFVESDWSPAQNLQCEDRAHRIGQQDKVLIQYLNMRGSIDYQISRACMKKMEIQKTAVDGAAGCSQ